eukprot:NODE_619_length_1323_cov_113.327759_g580_i0.p1 GENE.NODE_619_length_1323_cov_113.327759_g580_i0~~NODE_619_length_1323_cov_113.327759_g580_i0.p1  ORF type:complete len:400 (+),score=111.75 NODE_619_length_1323_cov_113.327759_g580_i0:109-1200(+)
MSKPNYLILGGVGFIGRNLAVHLIEKDLAGKVRIVDQKLPEVAYLTPKQKEAFAKCETKQANLVNPAHVERAFQDDVKYDYVINCAAETTYSRTDDVYNERVLTLTVNCAKEAAKQGVKKFIELSTAQVYDADKKSSEETSKIKPWTLVAKFKLKAEEELKKIDGLNYCIVRPAIVYGISDVQGIAPRLIIGAVYKQLGEEMKFLWSKDLRINTVHVNDVVKALLHLCEKGEQGEIYNLADKGDTNQETIAAHCRTMYGIKTGYQGSIISNFAKLNLESVTEDINDKHLQPWSDLCKSKGITNTPLTPYLDKELLYNNSLSVNGSKIEKTGFTYDHPEVTLDSLKEILQSYIDMKLFPEGIMG